MKLLTNAKNAAAEVASRTLSISYLRVGVAAVVLIVLATAIGLSIHHQSVKYKEKVVAAQKSEKEYKAQKEATEKINTQILSENVKLIEDNASIQKKLDLRNKQVQTHIVEVSNPDAPTSEVARNLEETYGIKTTIVDNRITIDAPSAQKMIVTKIERDAFAQDKADLKTQLNNEMKKTANLTTALSKETYLRVQAEKQADMWKGVAEEKKHQKVGNAIKHTLIVAGVGLAAYEIGKHTGGGSHVSVNIPALPR